MVAWCLTELQTQKHCVIFGAIPSRVIVPEILDALPPEDPRAKRSRKDLKFLDWFLANSAWLVEQVERRRRRSTSIAELGAGDGHLTLKLRQKFGQVTGLDLAPPPLNLPCGVGWIQGDFFESFPMCSADVVVGALILHHFDQEALRRLGGLLATRRLIVFVEPLRTMTSLWLSTPLLPFVGSVTRHDMQASIRAGFLPDELAGMLALNEEWTISETINWRGTLRFMAWRN